MSNPRDFLPAGTGYRSGWRANSEGAQAGAIPWTLLASICLILLPLTSCTRYEPVPLPRRYQPGPLSSCRGRITQVSVMSALLIGRYDGVIPIPDLLHCGDFGIGTLDYLDGELIVLDGHAYQVNGDGVVIEVRSDRSTPFAIVTPSEPDWESPCPGSTTSPT